MRVKRLDITLADNHVPLCTRVLLLVLINLYYNLVGTLNVHIICIVCVTLSVIIISQCGIV